MINIDYVLPGGEWDELSELKVKTMLYHFILKILWTYTVTKKDDDSLKEMFYYSKE